MTTYCIKRFYERDAHDTEVVATGLTLEEAQEHCRDDDTSSRTCFSTEGMLRTSRCGPWFEGYTEE